METVNPASTSLVGTILDEKYRLESKIGSGGFGTVFKATHLGLGQAVAVKILQADVSNATTDDLARFRQEGASACRIKHPNAVTVYDFGVTASGFAYLVMELLEGHSLATELRGHAPLPVVRAAEILIPICDVLAEAHSEGIVHRDIKPDNIFLHRTKRGEVVKVVDFGIAKLIDKAKDTTGKGYATTGGVIGTPAYMAPERLRNKPYDGRADVYSVGILLYEMLGGRVPFEASESGDVAAVILMQVTEDPKPLHELNAAISPAVETVVMQALAKDPEQRPTARELAESFARAAGVQIQMASAPFISTVAYDGRTGPAGRAAVTQHEPGLSEAFTVEADTRMYPKLPETEMVKGADTPKNPAVETGERRGVTNTPPEAYATRPMLVAEKGTLAKPATAGAAANLGPPAPATILVNPPATSHWKPYVAGGMVTLALGGLVFGGMKWFHSETPVAPPVPVTQMIPAPQPPPPIDPKAQPPQDEGKNIDSNLEPIDPDTDQPNEPPVIASKPAKPAKTNPKKADEGAAFVYKFKDPETGQDVVVTIPEKNGKNPESRPSVVTAPPKNNGTTGYPGTSVTPPKPPKPEDYSETRRQIEEEFRKGNLDRGAKEGMRMAIVQIMKAEIQEDERNGRYQEAQRKRKKLQSLMNHKF
ncbi:MAG: serine/threonine protein kinase [Blastocatellia bacterium]|nr:serine/threonine protein kinase [Blastocatellia bacterium]